jgi:hypothetical protein
MTTRSVNSLRTRKGSGRLMTLAGCAALVTTAMTLGGCGKSNDDKLEARLAALEAKTDEADKRSREALSMAATGNAAPMMEGGSDENFGEPVDQGEVTDTSPDSAIYDNTIESQPGPAIAPGG